MNELHTIENELNDWSNFLNIVVGAPSLAFALSCVSMDGVVSLIACAVSITMWLSLISYAKPSFSRKLRELRSLPTKDPRTAEIIDFAEKNFFSNSKFSPYLIGSYSLFIATGYCFFKFIKPFVFA
jgi:hypothetical protein